MSPDQLSHRLTRLASYIEKTESPSLTFTTKELTSILASLDDGPQEQTSAQVKSLTDDFQSDVLGGIGEILKSIEKIEKTSPNFDKQQDATKIIKGKEDLKAIYSQLKQVLSDLREGQFA
jgi:hypothetical protein